MGLLEETNNPYTNPRGWERLANGSYRKKPSSGGQPATAGEAQPTGPDARKFVLGARPATRIRQEQTPKLNKTEAKWRKILIVNHPDKNIRSQEVRLRLANGAWYKADHFAFGAFPSSAPGRPLCSAAAWENKGGKKMKGVAKGVLALKIAASQYPEICFTLVWIENGRWCEQEILP